MYKNRKIWYNIDQYESRPMEKGVTMLEGNGILIFMGLIILLVVIVAVIAVVASVAGTAAAIVDEEEEEE